MVKCRSNTWHDKHHLYAWSVALQNMIVSAASSTAVRFPCLSNVVTSRHLLHAAWSSRGVPHSPAVNIPAMHHFLFTLSRHQAKELGSWRWRKGFGVRNISDAPQHLCRKGLCFNLLCPASLHSSQHSAKTWSCVLQLSQQQFGYDCVLWLILQLISLLSTQMTPSLIFPSHCLKLPWNGLWHCITD